MDNAGFLVTVIVLILLTVLFARSLKKKVDENINSLEELDLKYKNKTLK